MTSLLLLALLGACAKPADNQPEPEGKTTPPAVVTPARSPKKDTGIVGHDSVIAPRMGKDAKGRTVLKDTM